MILLFMEQEMPVQSREEAFRQEQGNQGSQSFGNKRYFIKNADELEELGLKSYIIDANDDGSEKDHYVRFLPCQQEDGWFFGLKLFVHYSIGPDREAFLCPRHMKPELERHGIDVPEIIETGFCPICDDISDKWDVLKSSPDYQYDNPAFLPRRQALKRVGVNVKSPRYLMWNLDATNADEVNDQIYLIIVPSKVHDGFAAFCENKRTKEFTDLVDPKDGKIFTFSREGKGMEDTEYKGFKIEFSEESIVPDELIQIIPRFLEVLNFESVETLKQAYMGMSAEKDVKEEISERMMGSSSTPEEEEPINDTEMSPTQKRIAALKERLNENK